MRDLFPGYFPPKDDEFKELWRDAVFAFDANVLLGLYRLTTETQQVFFEVLQRLSGRIFLPNQAAHEYLRNRLDAISARTQSHEGLKVAADKFVVTLEKSLQEHSLPKGREIIDAAKLAAKTITEIVDATLRSEPNSLRSDDVLSQVMKLFEGKIGTNLDSNRNAVAKLEGFGDNLVTPCTRMQQSTPKMPPITPLKAVASYT